MGLTPRRAAVGAVAIAYLLVVAGTALVFIHPSFLALIVAGLGLGAVGLDELRSR